MRAYKIGANVTKKKIQGVTRAPSIVQGNGFFIHREEAKVLDRTFVLKTKGHFFRLSTSN